MKKDDFVQISRADLIAVLRDLNTIVVSTDRIGSCAEDVGSWDQVSREAWSATPAQADTRRGRAAIQFRLWDEDGAEDWRFLDFDTFPVWPRCAGRWSITVSLGETMS